jgi:purine-nucleoside phosphorylase
MSTVPETIVARHMGIEVLGISCVTNLAAGLGDKQLSHTEVFEAGRQVEHTLARLLTRLAPAVAERLAEGQPSMERQPSAEGPPPDDGQSLTEGLR